MVHFLTSVSHKKLLNLITYIFTTVLYMTENLILQNIAKAYIAYQAGRRSFSVCIENKRLKETISYAGR